MKTALLAVIVSLSLAPASAQDAGGRQRQPPGHGTNTGGNRGGSSGGNSGGNSGTRSGGNDRGTTWNQPSNNGGRTDNGGSTYNGGGSARRRVPTPGQGTIDGMNSTPQSGGNPSSSASGNLGRAVRRDSLPSSSYTGQIGGYRPNHYNETAYGYYWHSYGGYNYCHYVDSYGMSWYYWYFGDGYYYSMRYHDGFWWRYDPAYARWLWLHDGGWYYRNGGSTYYTGDNGVPEAVDDGSSDFPTYEPPKIAVTASLGHFGLNSGGAGSVVNENQSYLNFDGGVGGVNAMAEVNLGLNKYMEAGLGVGYQNASSGSQYIDYVKEDGSEIRQETRLRNIPMNVNLKVMPFGRDKQFQPYVGAGLQVNKWNYQESGQFIDFNSPNYDIYRETYKADGVAVGPVAIAGLRIPLNKTVSINGEYRHQWAKGALPSDGGFAGDHVDLGGNTFQAGLTINLK